MFAFKKLVFLSLGLLAYAILPSIVEGNQTHEPEIELIGEVIKRSELPEPSIAAYPDCLTFLKFKVVKVIKGHFNSKEALVAMWGFKNYKLSEPGKFTIGDKIKLKLIPYKSVENELSGIMRVDDTQDYDLELYWAPVWEIQDKQQKDVSKVMRPAIEKTKPKTDMVGKILRIIKAHDGEVIGGPNSKILFGYYWYLTYDKFWGKTYEKKNIRQIGVLDAILGFSEYLKTKNIQLIMVFPPSPVAIYPEVAANVDYNFDRDGRIDISFLNFLDELKKNGILYIDILPEFIRHKWSKGPDNNLYPLYFEDDHHWSEIAASLAGKAVANFIKNTELFKKLEKEFPPKDVKYQEKFKIAIRHKGSFSRENPDWNFPIPKFINRELIPNNGSEFILGKSDKKSPIWVLGDSFSEKAGFYQEISANLGLPCYVLSIPGGSQTPVRESFARIKDTSNIKVVIWEIAYNYIVNSPAWKSVEFNSERVCVLAEKISQAEFDSKNIAVAEVSLYGVSRKSISFTQSRDFPSIDAPVNIVWRGIHLGGNPIFSTAIGFKSNKLKNPSGVEFQVLVNGKILATRKLDPEEPGNSNKNLGPWSNNWDIDLSKFAGQTITIELKVNPLSSWDSVQVYWGNSIIEDAKF